MPVALRRAARRRRAAFLTLTLLTAAAATAMMCDILAANGLTDLKRMRVSVLFYVLFVWITGAFWTALAGFVVRLRGGDPLSLKPRRARRPAARRAYRRSSCRSTTRTPRE